MTDLKAESSLNAGELFCSTGDGQIFAIPLGSYLYVTLVINSIVTTYCSCFFLVSFCLQLLEVHLLVKEW